MIEARSGGAGTHLIDNAVHDPRDLRDMHRASPHLLTHLDAITSGKRIKGPRKRVGPAATEHEPQPEHKEVIQRGLKQLFDLNQGLAHGVGRVGLITLPIGPGQIPRKHASAGQIEVADAIPRGELGEPARAFHIGLPHRVDTVDLGD